MSAPQPGRLVIISGPSGVGKSSIVRGLMAACPLPLTVSVSATTRPPRHGEVDGVDYHFLAEADFLGRRQRGEFLETCQVFGRHWYGTLRETVRTGLEQGKWLILEIDVEGARQVLAAFSEAESIFVHPGSVAELERRLRGRDTEPEVEIQRRLEVATRELSAASEYRLVVVNHDLPTTIHSICQYLRQRESQHV